MKPLLHAPRAAFAGMRIAVLAVLSACASDNSGQPCGAACAPPIVDCGSGACAAIEVAGDGPASTPGTFRGLADPALATDPTAPDRIWFAYSWPHIVDGVALDSSPVQMAAVSTHLARSDDNGAGFTYVRDLWPAIPMADPEGSGEQGLLNSETASLAAMNVGGAVTWHGAHLRYFQQPRTGYHPRYATSWTVRIGAAASPEALAGASEAVLGVTATAAAYAPQARLDQLASLPQARCAMLNNPALYAERNTLYLIVECLAFIGTTPDLAHNTIQVFATTPEGMPSSWAFRYVGQLADATLAAELGSDAVQQPEVARAMDGILTLTVTPANADSSVAVGQLAEGCIALKMTSIEPPVIQRGADGNALVIGRIEGTGLGACSYAARSGTGMLVGRFGTPRNIWSVLVSGLRF